MLVTTNDTIRNWGMLNWNLAGGKQGFLDGYENITNTGNNAKQQLTIDDALRTSLTNIVIATGDFTNVAGKDTFAVTNVTSGAAFELTINSPRRRAGGAYWELVTVASGDTTSLVLKVVPPVTVIVPETDGASAELFVFDVDGGWAKVAPNEVPCNETVRVLWTAADGKGLTGEGAANAFEWQTTFGPVVGGETIPAPEVSAEGESEVTIALDTRTKKSYFRAEDILPVWYEMGEEVSAKGEGQGEQSLTTLVKDAVNNDTVCWTPTVPDTYKLTMSDLAPATIIYALPVEVTTNGLEHADTTFAVTDEDGKPLQPQADFGGKLIVASNSTVTVTYTVTTPGLYFADGTTTYTATFTADKSVNDAAKAIADQQPEGPDKPTMKIGVVGQRYPWDNKFDVEYKVTFWPKGRKGSCELLIDGKCVMSVAITPSGSGTVIGSKTITLPIGRKGKATVRVVK